MKLESPNVPPRRRRCARRCRCSMRWLPCSARLRAAAAQRRRAAPHGLHLHAAGLHRRIFFPEKAGTDYELDAVSRRAQGLPRRLHGHLRAVASGRRARATIRIASFLTAAPHPEQRAGFRNTHLARPVRGRAHRRRDALPQPGAVARGVQPVVDPQRRAGAVGRFAVAACSPSCFSKAGPTRSQPRSAGCATARASSTPSATRRSRLQSDSRRRRPREARRVLHQRSRTGATAGQGRGVGEEAEAEGRRGRRRTSPTPPTWSARRSLMFDLMHLALQTDSTRLITMHAGSARAWCRRSRA